MNKGIFFTLLAFLATAASAQEDMSLLSGIEARIGLILLIASGVIIVLLILVIFYLHSINEHLSWIRRIR